MGDESRRDAVKKVMRIMKMPRSMAEAYVDRKLLAIQRDLEAEKAPKVDQRFRVN